MWNWTWLDESLCDDEESSNFSDEDIAEESNKEDNDDGDTSNTDALPHHTLITHTPQYTCI